MDSFVIFIVGPAASGKSTLAATVLRAFPTFTFVSDLVALKELAHVNDCFQTMIAIQQQERYRSFSQEIEDLRGSFWNERSARKAQALAAGELRTEHLETVRTTDGGFRILDPAVWDDALSQTMASLENGGSHVVEFARGTDTKYLEYRAISPRQVYHSAFAIVAASRSRVVLDQSLIIHVSAVRAERERRNHLRRVRGEHYVSQETMDEVYADDVFTFDRSNQGDHQLGILSADLPIAVISVDNTPPDPEANFSPVIEFLRRYVSLGV